MSHARVGELIWGADFCAEPRFTVESAIFHLEKNRICSNYSEEG